MTTSINVPAEPDTTTPDLPAVTSLIEPAGWTLDAVTEMANDSVIYDYLHPTGRQITATVFPGGQHTVSLSGLDLGQVVGAVAGAGLAPDVDVTPGPEHYYAAGATGGPGACSAVCACGTAVAGFDTVAEAAAVLDQHIADPAAPADVASDPRRTFYGLVVAGVAAGLPIPSTISIPADNVIASVWLGDDNPDAVNQWAAYLGLPAASTDSVHTDGSRSWRNYKAETWAYPAMPGWCVRAESYVTVPTCSRCETTPARPGTCCSSHERRLCHLCYRRTHWVEVCVTGCKDCAAEGLPVDLADLAAQGGAR